MKYIVWDLFGGGQNSVYHSVQGSELNQHFQIYTFDLVRPQRQRQIQIDLSQPQILEVMKHYPKPDVIVASPLCQSFSQVLKMKGGGTGFWKCNDTNTKVIMRSREEFDALKSGFSSTYDTQKQYERAITGQKCLDNTISLIQHYQPKLWYIENPAGSFMWNYISLNTNLVGFKNSAHYHCYNHPTKKPTIFFSNIQMALKTDNQAKVDEYEFQTINDKVYKVHIPTQRKQKADLNSNSLSLKVIRSTLSSQGDSDVEESGVVSTIPKPLIQTIFTYFLKALKNQLGNGDSLNTTHYQPKLF